MRDTLQNVRLPGGLSGEFEDGGLVRLWARGGKHRIERVDDRTIFSLGLSRKDVDKQVASVFKRLCSQCGRLTDFAWELTSAPRDRMLCPECAVHRQGNLAKGIHRMLGDREYLVVKNGTRETLYPVDTSNMVFAALEDAAHADVRVKISYGDPITGRDWQETFETTGYVHRTYGAHVALLVHNARSMGGSPIMSDRIVRIASTHKGGRVFHQHSNYHLTARTEAV